MSNTLDEEIKADKQFLEFCNLGENCEPETGMNVLDACSSKEEVRVFYSGWKFHQQFLRSLIPN